MDTNTRKIIEKRLFSYYEMQRIIEDKTEVLHSSNMDFELKAKVQNAASDPYDQKCALMDSIDVLQNWIDCIDSTLARTGPLRRDLVIKWYFEGKHEYECCKELHVGRSAFYDWKKQVLYEVEVQAVRMFLLK